MEGQTRMVLQCWTETEPSVVVHNSNPSTEELRQMGGLFKASLNYIVRTFSQKSINLGLERRGLRQ